VSVYVTLHLKIQPPLPSPQRLTKISLVYYYAVRSLMKPGWLSRFNNSLRAGRSGDRIPVDARSVVISTPTLGVHPASHTKDTGSFEGIKQPERGFDHRPSSAEIKEEYSYTSTRPLGVRGFFYCEIYLFPMNIIWDVVADIMIRFCARRQTNLRSFHYRVKCRKGFYKEIFGWENMINNPVLRVEDKSVEL